MFSCLTIDDVSTEAAKTKRNTTEDVSNTELSCPEKGGVDKNHNFKGDVELFSCLSIDAVPTKTAKTERDTVQDVSNTKLLCPEKGGEIQSLPTRTLQSRMVVQSKARFWRRSICCKLGNTSKSSVILITAKLFPLKSTALNQNCRVVNIPSIVFNDRSLQSNKPMKGSSIHISTLQFTNTINKLNAKKNIFILISLARVVIKSNYLAIINFVLLYTAMFVSLNKLPYYNETLIFL